jgi:hypothetical protein
VNGFLGGGVTLEILSPSGNTVLGSVEVTNPDDNIRTFGTGAVVLPSTGTYRVRVRGIEDTGGSGPYRILVE